MTSLNSHVENINFQETLVHRQKNIYFIEIYHIEWKIKVYMKLSNRLVGSFLKNRFET